MTGPQVPPHTQPRLGVPAKEMWQDPACTACPRVTAAVAATDDAAAFAAYVDDGWPACEWTDLPAKLKDDWRYAAERAAQDEPHDGADGASL